MRCGIAGGGDRILGHDKAITAVRIRVAGGGAIDGVGRVGKNGLDERRCELRIGR